MNKDNDMRFLVVIETQKVKSYLFASPIMRETRGASLILDLLNRKETIKILNRFNDKVYEKIYLGGGSGRILFENIEDAETFRKELIRLYKLETVNAHVSVEIIHRKERESFTEWLRRGVAESQKNKYGRTEGIPVLAGRWVMPCTSCGLNPAEKTLNEHKKHRLCLACWKKREEVRNLYQNIKPSTNYNRKLKSTSELSSRYTDGIIFYTLAKNAEIDNIFLPQTFDDIGRASKPSNYMGFIYADGNRMGEVVKRIGEQFPIEEEAKKAYKAFSEIVDLATREAAVDAVVRTVSISGNGFIPVEFIMAGGDDLILSVPAHNALDVTIRFMEKYQEKTRTLQEQYVEKGRLSACFAPEGLTTSAGVVIAHTHYPVKDLMNFASELMKIAKKKAAQSLDNTFDVMIISESVSAAMKDRRKDDYCKEINGVKVKLTERPYSVSEGHWLLQTIRKLKKSGISRTKLKALYSSLFQHPLQAQFDAFRIKDRLKSTGDSDSANVFDRLFQDLDVFPFRRKSYNMWTTPLTEIIELYDYILIKDNEPRDEENVTLIAGGKI